MGRNRKIRMTSGPAAKGQVIFNPLSGDAHPQNGVNLQGPDSVGASPLTVTLPASVTDKGVYKSDSSGNQSVSLILNENVDPTAAIDPSKLAALTANRAVASDASGVIVPSATTDTELGYVAGVTSAIQTQLNSKQATGNYITALTGDVTASGPGSVVATIPNGTITDAKVSSSAAIAYSKLDLAASIQDTDINSGAANSGDVLTADGSGAASWQLSPSAVYQFIGSATLDLAASLTRANHTLGSFGSAGSGAVSIEFNPGTGTIQTPTVSAPTFTVNGLVAGYYKVRMSVTGNTDDNATLAISDGSSISGLVGFDGSQLKRYELLGFFHYTTTSNITFELFGATSSTGTVTIYSITSFAPGWLIDFSIERIG